MHSRVVSICKTNCIGINARMLHVHTLTRNVFNVDKSLLASLTDINIYKSKLLDIWLILLLVYSCTGEIAF